VAPAEFDGADGVEGMVPGGFDTAWLDETEPDCPGGVATCWLDTGEFDAARDGTAMNADETWPGEARFVSAGSRASMWE